jgi:hypothetical protein
MVSGEKENELKGHDDEVLDLCFDNNKDGCLLSASSDSPGGFGNDGENLAATNSRIFSALNLNLV